MSVIIISIIFFLRQRNNIIDSGISCTNGEEELCLGEHGATMTYNGYFNDPESDYNTFGGCSSHIVVNKEFLLTIPEKKIRAFKRCTYSLCRHYNLQSA